MINLPLIMKCVLLAVLMTIAIVFVGSRGWILPWPVLIVLPAGPFAVMAYRIGETEFTHIVIDGARLTWRGGLLTRRVASVELFRIQNVEAISTWWQRGLGFGTLVIESSDANHPLWILPGMPDAELMRDALNRRALALRDARGIREFNVGRV
ncbi:PH domain-containing protein [Paraburkholderia aspalathi]|nr:PH domain-containing protein [Paraburkholderia aspalathi]